MAYMLDSDRIYDKMCPALHRIISNRAHAILGEHLETFNDAEEFVDEYGYLVGVDPM